MQVDEFGFGFPPRIGGVYKAGGKWQFVWGNKTPENLDEGKTVYSINLIPLGGFVKILGENNEHENNPKSFINKGFWPRFLTLVAGVTMNVLLAWVLISTSFVIGTRAGVNELSDIPKGASFTNPQMEITEVVKGLPAEQAGLKVEDVILSLNANKVSKVKEVQEFVKEHAGTPIAFEVKRGTEELSIKVTPTLNPPQGQGPTGIAIALVGKIQYVWHQAFWEGAKTTGKALVGIVSGLYQLFAGNIGFGSLGGPVQIAKIVGVVRQSGLLALINLTAFLSLNLAVLNILPFPALDGGRVLFLIIEKIRRKKNNQKIEQYVNAAGFAFLILLMVAVTVNDVIRK
jgi:regulator of sigma E protease